MASHPTLYTAVGSEAGSKPWFEEPWTEGPDSDVEPLIDEVLDLCEATGMSRLAALRGVLGIDAETDEEWMARLQSLAVKMRAA